jgi:WD40 repeat protein
MRTRWVGPVAGATAAVLIVLCAATPPWFGTGQTRSSGPATLPDRLARYSYLTALVSESPPGRAIMVYDQGLGVEILDYPQSVLLGADGDVYRRLDRAERESHRAPVLLAPDGTRIAVGSTGTGGDVAVVAMSTGEVVTLPSTTGRAAATPLAWSPDGRYLAVKQTPDWRGADAAGQLVLFDTTGTRPPTVYEDYPFVFRAAFSPRGDELALQPFAGPANPGDAPVTIVDLSGRSIRTVPARQGFGLASNTAWSPDGRLLALGSLAITSGPPTTVSDSTIMFVDATGTGRPVPPFLVAPSHVPPLGWTAPERLVFWFENSRDIGDVDIGTGQRRTLTVRDAGPSDNFMFAEIGFAAGLLLDVQVRPAGAPERGPRPDWLKVLIGVAVVLCLLPAVFLIRRPSRP